MNKRVNINSEKCKGCGLCVLICPRKTLEMSKEFNKAGYHPAIFIGEDKCTSCGFCYQMCPDVCIEVYKP